MIIIYSANGVSGTMGLPPSYVGVCCAEDMAELVAHNYWRSWRAEAPSVVTLVHLQDVDGSDLGLFEVRCKFRPVFKATPLVSAG